MTTVKTIGLICAVEKECDRILPALRNPKKGTIGATHMVDGGFGGMRVVVGIAGIGKVNAALGTAILMNLVNPDVVLNLGIAGGYGENPPGVGGVAVARKEIYADEGVVDGKSFRGMGEIGIPLLKRDGRSFFNVFPADRSLTASMKRAGEVVTVTTVSGDFLTVSSVSGSRTRAKRLEKRFSGICENMEGAAVFHVAYAFRKPCAAVRGISNLAGIRDKRKWKIDAASENCQKVVLAFLESLI